MTATVHLKQTSTTPPVFVATCPCGHQTEEVGDQVYAVQLWEAHANAAGHDGNFQLVVTGG